MPANIESMFSVRQMPWHREGTILERLPRQLGRCPDPGRAGLGPGNRRGVRGHRHQPRRQRALRARSGAGKPSAAPTPEPSCRSTRTPTPSSTTAKWARSSKRSSLSRTSSGKPRASWTAARPSGASRCSMSPSPCPATPARPCPIWPSPTGTTAPPPAPCARPPSGSCAPTPSAPPNWKASAPAPPSPSSTNPPGVTGSTRPAQAVTGAKAEMRRYAELAS